MKLYGRRRVEVAELLYKDSEVDAVLRMTSRQGWVPMGDPQPVHRILLRRVLGKRPVTTRGGLDIMKGWKVIRLQRPHQSV